MAGALDLICIIPSTVCAADGQTRSVDGKREQTDC